jgi:hypothetical protein
MQTSVTPAELLKLIHKAEEAYETKRGSALAQRMRVQAMKRFALDCRKRSPNTKITISLEDHLVLTDLP